VVVRSVEPSGAAVFEAVPGREEYDSGEEGAAEWEKKRSSLHKKRSSLRGRTTVAKVGPLRARDRGSNRCVRRKHPL
jgi:hypothetical protein